MNILWPIRKRRNEKENVPSTSEKSTQIPCKNEADEFCVCFPEIVRHKYDEAFLIAATEYYCPTITTQEQELQVAGISSVTEYECPIQVQIHSPWEENDLNNNPETVI